MVWDKIIYWGSEYGGALQACLISAPILFLHASSHKLDKSSTLMVLFCLYHVHRREHFRCCVTGPWKMKSPGMRPKCRFTSSTTNAFEDPWWLNINTSLITYTGKREKIDLSMLTWVWVSMVWNSKCYFYSCISASFTQFLFFAFIIQDATVRINNCTRKSKILNFFEFANYNNLLSNEN